MSAPDDCLKIPNPSDISAAVSRALCLTESDKKKRSNSITKLEEDYILSGALQLTDESPFFSEIEQSFPEDFNVDILEIEGNLEQLERFCRFIDSPTPDKRNTEVSRIRVMEKDPDWEPKKSHTGEYEYPGRSSSHKTRSQKRKRSECLAASRKQGQHCVSAFQNKLPLFKPESTITKDGWSVTLVNADNWRLFYASGTEMIITKAGRRMFPWISIQVKGLEPVSEYSIKVDFVSADDNRYKYVAEEWIAVGKVEMKLKPSEHSPYKLPPPYTGEGLMRETDINFRGIKLTNNKATKQREHQVVLNSMQKYQPRIRITSLEGVDKGSTQYFSFPETVFIAVTAYQSDEITQLKIRYNPYAKAFREDVTSTNEMGEIYSKPGGHAKRMKKSRYSRPNSPMATPSPIEVPTDSITSLESGFESGSTAEAENDSNSSKPCTPQKVHIRKEIAPKTTKRLRPEHSLYTYIPETPIKPLTMGYIDQRYSLYCDQDVLISSPAESPEQSFSEPYLRQYLSSCDSQHTWFSSLKPLKLTSSPLESPLLKWQSSTHHDESLIQPSPTIKVEDDVFYT